jgi:hypothetical protein
MAVQCLAPCVFGDLAGFQTSSGTVSAALDPWDGDNADGYVLRCNPATTGAGYAVLGGVTAAGAPTFLSLSTVYYSFDFGYTTKPGAGFEPVFRAMNATSATKAALYMTSAGKLSFNSVDMATALDADTWYRIDAMFGVESVSTANDAPYEIRVNGVTEWSGVGDLGTSLNSAIRLGKAFNSSGQTVDFYYRNMRVSDSGFPDPASRQRVLLPDGAGNYSGATSGTYADVDELPNNGDTSYLGFVSNTGKHSCTLQACAARGVSGTVPAVMPFGYGRDTGAVAVGHKGFLRSGGTDTDSGTGVDAGGSYGPFALKVFETDPTDAAAWTTAKLDALEVGVYMGASSATEQRVTLLGVVVEFVPAPPPTGGSRRQPCFGLPGLR